jgi:hypothetical protein
VARALHNTEQTVSGYAIDDRNDRKLRETQMSEIVIIDIKMPFISMVIFMVKAAIAAIPALIILALLGAIAVAILGGVAGS